MYLSLPFIFPFWPQPPVYKITKTIWISDNSSGRTSLTKYTSLLLRLAAQPTSYKLAIAVLGPRHLTMSQRLRRSHRKTRDYDEYHRNLARLAAVWPSIIDICKWRDKRGCLHVKDMIRTAMG